MRKANNEFVLVRCSECSTIFEVEETTSQGGNAFCVPCGKLTQCTLAYKLTTTWEDSYPNVAKTLRAFGLLSPKSETRTRYEFDKKLFRE